MGHTALGLFAAALATSVAATPAAAVDFNYGSLAPGSYSSVTLTSGGLGLSVTTLGGARVSVENPDVALLGANALISEYSSMVGYEPLRYAFNQPIGSATFDFGDMGGDDDSPFEVVAYDIAKKAIGSATASYPQGYAAGKSVTVVAPGAAYFIVSSGSTTGNENSVFSLVRNVTPYALVAGAAPEPDTWAMMIVGFGLVGASMRRRREKLAVRFA